MYLCFLGWWEIFPHLPPRLLSPLLCWPAFCWEEGIVVGVIQEEQGEGGGVGTIKHWWDASEDREEKGKQRPKEEEEEQSLMPSCSSLWSQNGSCSLLNFPWIYPGHTQCAHTHTHPRSSHIVKPPLFTEEQPLSPRPLPRPDSGSSFSLSLPRVRHRFFTSTQTLVYGCGEPKA